MLHGECDGRDVEWRIAKLPALDCDPILMAQVFQNLLSNALKYSRGRPKAVIEVDSIQAPGKPAIIFVRDNGAGFNLQYAEKLFGVFQRFHTDSEFEGTGVGLATVHRIIQKHGGMVWAESEPDHGATSGRVRLRRDAGCRADPDALDSRQAALADAREEEIKATASLLNARVQLLAVRGELLGGLGLGGPG